MNECSELFFLQININKNKNYTLLMLSAGIDTMAAY